MESKTQVQLTTYWNRSRHRRPHITAGCVLLVSLLLAAGLSPRVAWGETTNDPADPQPAATRPSPMVDEDRPESPPHRPHLDPKGDDEPLLRTLNEFYPEQARRLRALRESNPEEFARRVGQMRPWLHELREARARNPELARLLVEKHRTEMAISDWERRYREASPEQQKELTAEGKQLAEQRVDARLQISRAEIQMMEKRLQGLKTRLQEREAHKDASVNRELENMKNPPASQPARPGSS